RSSGYRTGKRVVWRAATTTTATARARAAAAAEQSSRRQLPRESARHGGQRGDIGPVSGGERDPVELLEQVAQLPQRRVRTHALDGLQPPDRPRGDGFGLPGGEPPRVGDLTFQWNWRCRLAGPGSTPPRGHPRG